MKLTYRHILAVALVQIAAGCRDPGPTRQELSGLLGKPMNEVLGELAVSTNKLVAFDEPPGLWRGCMGALQSNPAIGIDLYVARIDAIQTAGRRVLPSDFSEKPVSGIVLHYPASMRRPDLQVGEAIPWYVSGTN
jgi:hypothetical protein